MASVRWLRLAGLILLILCVYFLAPVDTSTHWENFARGQHPDQT